MTPVHFCNTPAGGGAPDDLGSRSPETSSGGSTDPAALLSEFARELRRRWELLGLSQTALAELSGVSRTVICQTEGGARVPTVRTYARLRSALGLDVPAAALLPELPPVRLDGDVVAALCAALLVTQEVSLADLASALELSVPAVRENLDQAAERLLAVGFTLTASMRLTRRRLRSRQRLAPVPRTDYGFQGCGRSRRSSGWRWSDRPSRRSNTCHTTEGGVRWAAQNSRNTQTSTPT